MRAHRRQWMLLALAGPAALALGPQRAFAHHGWSSFDLNRPIYLQGVAANVRWVNPHAELDLTLAQGLAVPADLARRPVPAQRQQVDGAGILAKAQLPRRRDPKWNVELAPLTRMADWKVPEIRNGQTVAVVGYTFKDEAGEAILRAEYLLLEGQMYGLRSSPA
jgi:hypothetical protein